MPKEQSAYSKRYAPRPGVKPKEKKQTPEQKRAARRRAPLLDDDNVKELFEDGIDAVFAKLREAGEGDRVLILSGMQDGPAISNTMETTFVIPSYKYDDGTKCIQMLDIPLDYNYNAYEKTKPIMVNAMEMRSAAAYYYGNVHIDSGKPGDTFEGYQVKDRMEQAWDGGPGIVKTWDRGDKDDGNVYYTGDKKHRTPGIPEIDEKDIRTWAYDPMDRA